VVAPAKLKGRDMEEKIKQIFQNNGLLANPNSLLDPLRKRGHLLSTEEYFVKGVGILTELMKCIERQNQEIEKYKSVLAQIRKEFGFEKYDLDLFYAQDESGASDEPK